MNLTSMFDIYSTTVLQYYIFMREILYKWLTTKPQTCARVSTKFEPRGNFTSDRIVFSFYQTLTSLSIISYTARLMEKITDMFEQGLSFIYFICPCNNKYTRYLSPWGMYCTVPGEL